MFTLLVSASPGIAQTWIANYTGMNGPTFVALDPGRTIGGTTATWLYISEHGETDGSAGGRIFRVNTATGASTLVMAAYDAVTNPNGFKSPDAIIIDPTTGDLYISDRYLNRVQRITNTGTFVMRWGSSVAGALDEMHGPLGLARDSSGAIYVGEHGDTNGAGVNSNMVAKYTVTQGTGGIWTATRVWRVGGSGSGNGQFATPYGMTINGSSLMVSDGFNARVQYLDAATGAYQSQFSVGSGVIPLGLSISGSTLYIAEASLSTTQQVNRRNPTTGAQLAAGPWGSQGSANGQFDLPFSAVVDTATNRVYVADYTNDRVQVFDLSASPTTPVVNSPTTASATVGTAFTYQITATNSPTSFGATGFPTNGLTFNASTGVISGTPTATGTVTTQMTATNASGTSAPVGLTITVSGSGGGGTPTLPVGPSVTGVALGNVTQLPGPLASSATLTVTFDASVTGVDASDFVMVGPGAITTVTGSGTTWNVNFNYTNDNPANLQIAIKTASTGISSAGGAFYGRGVTATPAYGINAGTIDAPTVSTFTAGTAGASSVAFTLTFSEAVTGVDAADFVVAKTSGVTAASVASVTGSGASYTVTVNYTGSGSVMLFVPGGATTAIRAAAAGNAYYAGGGNSTSAVATVGGTGTGTAPAFTNPTGGAGTASGTVGTAFSYTLAASGSPAPTFAVTSGTLPAGLALNGTTGAITGTPTAATPTGGTTVTFSATNSAGTASATLTFNIGSSATAPAFTNPAGGTGTASGTVGTSFSYTLAASGSPAPTFAVTAGTLPAGLTLNGTTGAITGTPTAATATGGAAVTFSATNSAGTASATVTFTITASGGNTVPAFTNPAGGSGTASGTVGTAFSYTLAASGSPAPTFTVTTGTLPAGLSLNGTTGAITGTPTAATPSGGTSVTFRASNTAGSATATVVFNIGSGAPAFTSPAGGSGTVSGTVGSSFSYTLAASGSPAPTFTVSSGTLPSGLSLNGTTGAITGTPTAGSSSTVTFRASNSAGSATATVTFNIAAGSPPAISSALSASTQAGAFFSYTITASNSPTSFSATGLPAGLSFSSPNISGTVSTAGTYSITIGASNAFGSDSKTLTLTVSAPTPPPPPPPSGGGGGIVVGGGGGGSITVPQTIVFLPPTEILMGSTLTLSASATSNGPITFSLVSGSATISGNVLTPTSPGAIVVRASQSGTSVWQPASTTAVINARNKQTITFNSPVSGVIINTPITLSATSSAGLPVTFTLVSGNATLSGNTLTPKGTGAIVVRASSAATETVAAASTDVNFGNPQKAAQAINLALNDLTTATGPISLSTLSSAGLPVSYTVSGPARLQGSSLVLNGAAGTVTVRATAAGNDIYNAADVSRSFNVRAIGQQLYLGSIGSDTFALMISQDNSRGMFVTRFAASGEALIAKFTLNANGTFSSSGTSSLPASERNPGSPAVAALVARTVEGTVSNGVVTGTIPELGTNFTANVATPTGATSSLAGVYTLSIPGSASGDTYIVVSPTGQAYAVAVTPFGITSGTGTVSSTGEFNITTSGGTISGTIDPANGSISGLLDNGGATATLVGLSEGANRSDRLVNLSSRLRTSGEATRAMIAGFVVTGSEPKQMLIRAIGPSLSAFGVQGALANPRLQIYNSAGALIAENEDWANNADVAAAAEQVGAFKLDGASRDAAILATLEPGAYTAQVATNGGTGVALIEVYDATAGTTGGRQLVNISTRGFVDTGDGNLIAGFVVSGNAPKRVLIRGIGPGLAQFGVQGAVANPTLKLYASGSSTVIAQNDDWSVAQPISAAQAAATAADISAAATATGAFPLATSSRDAAIVITLMPGAYTAVVGDANNGTGAGLIEVYEISNL